MNFNFNERLKVLLDLWFTSSWDRDSPRPKELVPYWWGYTYDGDVCRALTVAEQQDIDDKLRVEFEEDLKKAANGEYDTKDHEGRLALIILFDQISRNIYRKKKEAFDFDKYSLALTHAILSDGSIKKYKFFEKVFIFLPLMHSESLEDENLCFTLFTELYNEHQNNEPMNFIAKSFISYAEEHREIIVEFGRYPHRNNVLGRESTEKEKKYLDNGGKTFNQ